MSTVAPRPDWYTHISRVYGPLHATFSLACAFLLAYGAWYHQWLTMAIGFLGVAQAVNHMLWYRRLWQRAVADAPVAASAAKP